jgi:uncharacterized protein
MTDLLMLLPPSEGKAQGGSGEWDPGEGRFAGLCDQRLAVADALAEAVRNGDLPTHQKMFGIGGPHLERAVDSALNLEHAPTLAAQDRYTGVVHGHMSSGTLGLAARRRASRSVVILSGLLGVIGVEDQIPDYRCKMGLRLEPVGLLSAHWRDPISEQLAPLAAQGLVVDLLPGEHAKAVDPAIYMNGVVTVRFETETIHAGVPVRKVIGHDAKAAKGLLARHLLMASSPTKALLSFDELGWELDGESDLKVGRGRANGTAIYVQRSPLP